MSDDPTNDLEGIFSTEKGWTQPKPAEGRQDASVVKRGADGEEQVLKKLGESAQDDAAGAGAAGTPGHADDGGGREGEPPADDAESVGESEASAEHQPAEEPKNEAQPADLTPPEVNLEPPAIGGGKKKSSGGGSRKRSSGGRGKKKQEQSVAKKDEGRNPSTSYYGMPFDKLKELEGQYSALAIQIRRRSPTGQWASIKGLSRCLMPPKAIFDILRPVERYTGGGTFIFDVMDPHTRDLLVRFQESITGNPKPEPDNATIGYVEERDSLEIVPDNPAAPTPAAGYQDPNYGAQGMGIFGQGGIPMGGPHPLSAGAQGGAPGQAPAFPQPRVNPYTNKVEPPPAQLAEQLPGYMKGYSAEAQWHYLREKYQQDHGHPPNQGGATDIAMYYGQQRDRDLTTVMAEKSRLEEKVNGLQHQFQEQLEREREARYKAEAEAERLKSENKYSALEAKLAALEQAPKDKSGWDPEMTKALVGLGTSIVPALLQAWGNSSKAQKDQLVEMLKATQKSGGGFEDMLKTVLPAALPLIQEKMQQNSPQAQAEVKMAENDTAMGALKMMFDMKMAEAEAEGNQPWWMPLIYQIAESLTGGAGEMMEKMQQAKGGGGPQPALPQGQQKPAPQQGAQAQQQAQMLDPTARMWQSMLEQDEAATKATQLVWQHLPANEGWHTHEWARLIFYMHAKVDPADLADLFADHLEHCRDFEILPPAIAGVFDSPEQEVRKIVMQLPIAQGLPQMAPVKYEADPEYAEAIIARTTDELSLRERERRKVEEEEQEEQSAGAGSNGASGETLHDYVDAQGEEAQPAPVRSFTKPGGAE